MKVKIIYEKGDSIAQRLRFGSTMKAYFPEVPVKVIREDDLE